MIYPVTTNNTAIIYSVSANTTLLWPISLQPILQCYALSHYSQYYIAMIYSVQPILHCHNLFCHSQYYTKMNYLVTANYIPELHLITAITTLLYPISLHPILNCYELSCYNQYYNAIIYSVQPILHCYDLSRYSQYYIPMSYLVTDNPTLLWTISLQSILHCYDTTTVILW